MEYIQGAATGTEGERESGEEACVFCAIPASESDRVLARGELTYVVLNKFPYNPGHLLVVPLRHVAEIEDLRAEENAELQSMLQRSVRALRDESAPHGFNIGMNLGGVAGAGIPGHLHWHVVPRWSGDTNFTTTVGETRVLPELLAEASRRLAPRFAT